MTLSRAGFEPAQRGAYVPLPGALTIRPPDRDTKNNTEMTMIAILKHMIHAGDLPRRLKKLLPLFPHV